MKPASPVPTPPELPAAPVLPGVPMKPSGPSATAGQPIQSKPRAELPPGIPQHMASMVTHKAATPPPAVPEVKLHPTFGAPDARRQQHRLQASALRSSLQASVKDLTSRLASINQGLDYVSANEAAADFAAEGLDLGLIVSYRDKLAAALKLTEPAES